MKSKSQSTRADAITVPRAASTRGRVGEAAGLNCCGAAGAELDHSPNTYKTVALRCSLSSGALARRRLPLAGSVPDAIATYCLPLTSKVIGGAEKAEPILICRLANAVS